MKEMSMQETLELLVEKGIGKHERQLASVIKNGKLANKKQVEAVERSLEQLFESFEIEKGTGKKAIVRVGAKLNKIAERDDNRGRKISEAQIDFAINSLGLVINDNLIGKPYTLSTWANKLGVPLYNTSKYSSDIQKLVKSLEETFKMKHTSDELTKEEFQYPMPRFQWFRSVDIARDFADKYNRRAKGIVSTFFRYAEQQELITTKKVWSAITVDEKYIDIDEEVYKEFKTKEKEIIEHFGFRVIDYYEKSHEYEKYIQKIKNIDEQWESFAEKYKKINDELVERYSFYKAFESIEIIEVSDKVEEEIINPLAAEVRVNNEILKNDMVSDMYKRSFVSSSDYAKNLIKQSDFKKRFAYLIATVLLDKTDTEHMANFKNDLQGYIRNFENYVESKAAVVGFNSKEEVEQKIDSKVKEAIKIIKMYELNNITEEQKIMYEVNEYNSQKLIDINKEFGEQQQEKKERKRIQFYDDLAAESYGIANLLLDKAIEKEENEYWHNVFN